MNTPARKSPRLKKGSPTSVVSLSSTSSLGKRPRNQEEETWEGHFERMKKSRKDDFSIRYYFTSGPQGTPIEQADRDFVARAMEYYAFKSKRDPLVAVPPLSDDIMGVTNNRDEDHPVREVFKTVKHLNEMYSFLQRSRAAHHDIVVNISIDGSRYFQIL